MFLLFYDKMLIWESKKEETLKEHLSSKNVYCNLQVIILFFFLGVKDEVAMVMSSMHEWGKDMFDLVFPVKVCYVSAGLMHIYYY